MADNNTVTKITELCVNRKFPYSRDRCKAIQVRLAMMQSALRAYNASSQLISNANGDSAAARDQQYRIILHARHKPAKGAFDPLTHHKTKQL